MTNTERQVIVDQCVARLMEVTDCVQILGSYHDEEGTHSLYIGAGNWFARTGMAHDFLDRDEANTSANAVKPYLTQPPPEDGENWKSQ